jgi:hypothetical protein
MDARENSSGSFFLCAFCGACAAVGVLLAFVAVDEGAAMLPSVLRGAGGGFFCVWAALLVGHQLHRWASSLPRRFVAWWDSLKTPTPRMRDTKATEP